MSFTHKRTVYLADTDAAGVVYFANVLIMCHEAYETSLATADISLKKLLSDRAIALPIVHSTVDFLRPMFCGEQLLIELSSQQLSDTEFEIAYNIVATSSSEQCLAKAITRHVCINPMTRKRTRLPEIIVQWLK
ncbi:MAG: acyl-CoA thioesterase [Symploca sp. SIO2D2]|nr:acyl-CoA thioesterase [Symploca sp. SIO2D2]